MDQNQTIKQPKYAEHYKDVEARKKYQREYQLARYHNKKALQSVTAGEGIMENNKSIAPAITGNAPVDQFQGALNALTETLGPDDGVAKFIKKVQPFVPLATAFIQGFVQNMNAQQAAAQGQNKQQGPQAPEGWLYLDGINKLKRKYNPDGSVSSWWMAGEHYDQQVAIYGVNGSIQSGMPAPMEQTIHGQREAAIQRREQQMQGQRTMRDLERQAQQFDAKPAQDTQDMAAAREVPRSDGAPATIDEAIKAKEQPQDQDPGITGDQAKEIIQEIAPKLQEDAVKYLNLVVNYFKTRPLDQFEADLKNIDKMIEQYSTFIDLLPFQAKEAFKRISAEDLEKMLKEQDPEKHKMLVKKKLKPKLHKLWDELKSRF